MHIEHDEIARLAYRLWEERGRPQGSPEVDWHRAVELLIGGESPRTLPAIAGMAFWHETQTRI
jgi:hypothetical protein